jgi:hypothetical protein
MDLSITAIRFKFGSSPDAMPLKITKPAVIVLVGPNNSGKSLTLREIEKWIGSYDFEGNIIEKIEFQYPDDKSEIIQMLREFEDDRPPGVADSDSRIWVRYNYIQEPGQPHAQPAEIDLDVFWDDETNREKNVRRFLLRAYTIRLDGRKRFLLAEPMPSGSRHERPKNLLSRLFNKETALKEIQRIVLDTIDKHMVIDPTLMQQYRICLHEKKPEDPSVETDVGKRGTNFHASGTSLDQFGDGYQCFVGLLSAVRCLPHKVILIDEPEAFLHPPLARAMGKHFSELAGNRNACLVAATHSADFVMGCMESAANIMIIRLTYAPSRPTSRLLGSEEIKKLMSDPLLRSIGVMRALFYRAVVVTEADADRAFYDEINRRLQNEKRGVADALFINAQNWQTILRIIKPLRQLGIPSAAVMDLDVLCREDHEWEKIYDAIGVVDSGDRHSMESTRKICKSALNGCSAGNGNKQYKRDGIDAVSSHYKQVIQDYCSNLSEFGLFIVWVGELEDWLRNLKVTRTKGKWIVCMLDRLGSNPSLDNYVTPGHGDVWEFLDLVEGWIKNPDRKGIPRG